MNWPFNSVGVFQNGFPFMKGKLLSYILLTWCDKTKQCWVATKSTFHVGSSEKKTKRRNLWSHLCIRRADSREACLYSNKVHSHIVHQPSRWGLSDVSEAAKPSSPFPLCSFQGNMCAGILPQLRQGLARSAVGTNRVWENRGTNPLSFPHRHSASFSFALVHEDTSLPSFSPLL